MKIDQIFRYARPYSSSPETIDGLPNFFFYTNYKDGKLVLLDAGINSPAKIKKNGLDRVPAVMLRSSVHKVGTEDTPWQDILRPDYGHIKYFGDNKTPGADPKDAAGNQIMLREFALHQSSDKADRLRAAPILAFKSISLDGRVKGQIKFQGVSLIERVERVVQIDGISGLPFVNYSFDLLVLDLLSENEVFDWRWINDRRNENLSEQDALRYAPMSWRKWVENGKLVNNQIRRYVFKENIVPKSLQSPLKGSKEEKTLRAIYSYFDNKKHRFEAVAFYIASRVLGGNRGSYKGGWITQASGDNGIDFVGRLDIGSELASTKLVVLGQAKCEDPTKPTNGKDIARTVARLRRGWIGLYVTTSFFSDSTQKEVYEDQYPIIMVDGNRVAKEILTAMLEEGISEVKDILDKIDSTYESLLAKRLPEEILYI